MSDNTPLPQGAPLWRRFMAMVYDSFLLGALIMGYGALVTFTLWLLRGDTTQGEYRPMIHSNLGNGLFLIGLVLTLTGFYVFFWRRAGQTAGMRAWRLRVVQRQALPQTQLPLLQQCIKRALIAIPSLLMLGIGFWWRWFDSGGDCLQDRLSGTRVVVTPPRK